MTDSICSCHTPLRWFLAKRPVVLALEFAAAACIASVGGWVANKVSHKANREAQALERIAGAMDTFAYPVRCRP